MKTSSQFSFKAFLRRNFAGLAELWDRPIKLNGGRAKKQPPAAAHFLLLVDRVIMGRCIASWVHTFGVMVMSQLGIASGLLLLVVAGGTLQAQTSSSVPPPPPPGQVTAPALEGPTTDLEPIEANEPARQNAAPREGEARVTNHDVLQPSETSRRPARVYAPNQPPAPVSERPSGARPERQAVWISGYWDWDPDRAEFYWMGGLWQVPAPGSNWIGARWMRDQKGWYRSPGFWSRRRGQVAVETGFSDDVQPAWRTEGPPADHPVDKPSAPPGPDFFYIPGHFAPDGDQLRWKPGFWSRSQPGWDWIPVRWVHRASGWEFRAGHWVAEPDAVDVNVKITERGEAGIDRPAPPPGEEDERDVIAESEAAGRRIVRREVGPVVVVPRGGMPYYVIRPPGMYPYGPTGVVVPGAVPPFVRRILDRVLP
jgi:hypothetical protein